MIIFGVCVGDPARYHRDALPSIRAAAADGDLIWTRTGERGIAAAYNEMLLAAREIEECQAVVLLHEDVRIVDRNFRAKLLGSLDPDIGVVGVVGASRLPSSEWWASRHKAGFVYETRGVVDYGERHRDVDVVDGLFLAITREAFSTIMFDGDCCPAFHGYDVDYCLQSREAGLRVVVRAIDLFHRARGGYGDDTAFYAAKAALQRKWAHRFEPTRTPPKLLAASDRATRVARAIRRDPRAALAAAQARLSNLLSRRGGDGTVTVPAPTSVAHPAPPPSLPCAACSGELSAPPDDRRAVSILTCPSCGTGTTWPPPSRDVTGKGLFDESYAGQRLSNRWRWLRDSRVRLNWVQLHTHHGMLLDVGCATGEFVAVATSAGFDAHGIEVSEWAAQEARAFGARVEQGYLHDWCRKHPGIRLDAVTMWHVLEHVPDPAEVLRQIAAILQPDGTLFLEVPNFGCTSARRHGAQWRFATLTDHHHHYTAPGLQALLRSCGLEPVEVLEIPVTIFHHARDVRAYRNQMLVEEIDWPDKDLLRVRAKPAAP